MSETAPIPANNSPSGQPRDYGISDLPTLVRPWRLGWTKVLGVVSGSVFTCGFLYLWSYWHHFGVDFLDYISFDEIISRSLFGVVPTMAFVVEVMVFTFAIMAIGPVERWLRRTDAKEKRDPHKERKAAYLYFPGLLVVMLLVVGGFCYYERGDTEALVGGLPVLGGLIGWVEGLRRDYRLKQVGFCVGLAMGTLAALSFASGDATAGRVRQAPDVVREFATTLEGKDAELLADRVYAGRMGGYVFFASKTKQSTIAVPEGNLKYLHIWRPKDQAKK